MIEMDTCLLPQAQEDKPFVLAPTPAQLGKAPLQRRQSQGNCLPLPLSFTPVIGAHVIEKKDSMKPCEEAPSNETAEKSEDKLIKETENTTPVEANPEPLTIRIDLAPDENEDGKEDESASQLTPTPKSFFKKNVEDGMDK